MAENSWRAAELGLQVLQQLRMSPQCPVFQSIIYTAHPLGQQFFPSHFRQAQPSWAQTPKVAVTQVAS